MINADWVQLNCRVKPTIIEFCRLEYAPDGSAIKSPGVIQQKISTCEVPFHRDYTVKKQPIRTSLVDSVYYVYYNTTKIAEVLTNVNNPTIDPLTVFVRFDNKFLYGAKLYERVNMFLNDNGLLFHNWTRLDVACDFNNLYNERGEKKLNPHTFIEKFLDGRYKLLNKRRGKKRKGGMWFEVGENGIEYQTLYLGSPTSSVRTKFYNKTAEMRDKEDKPHIRDQWKLNDDIDPDQTVWRCEFSVMDFKAIALADDELKFSLRTLEILKDENIELLWNVLREHYFVFYKEDGKKNVTRKKKLNLFNYESTGIKLCNLSKKENSTRSTKTFIKKLLETQAIIRHHSEMQKLAFTTDFVAAHLVAKHDLMEWAKQKFPGWQVENYVEPPAMDIQVSQFTLLPDGSLQSEKHRFSLNKF